MNPYVIEKILEERKRETAAETTRLRLIAIYDRAHPSKRALLLAALGKKLIEAGEKLQMRYGDASKLHLETKICGLKPS